MLKINACYVCITHKIIRLRLFTQTFPENYSVSALGSFPVKVIFYIGNNSVPKFISRLSKFAVYRGSGLRRFYCSYKQCQECVETCHVKFLLSLVNINKAANNRVNSQMSNQTT